MAQLLQNNLRGLFTEESCFITHINLLYEDSN